jgi:hypothetical protein
MGDPRQEELLDRLHAFLKQAEDCPLIVGNRVDGISITGGTSEVVDHKLGRQPEGWFPVDRTADADDVYRSAWNSRTITLECSRNITLDIWVF